MFERSLLITCLVFASCSDKSSGTPDSGESGSGEPPTAQITAPTDTETVPEGGLYIARGLVSDPDDAIESLVVHWFIGDEEIPRDCPQGIRPDADGLTACDVAFSLDKPLLRLRVEDNDGNSSQDAVTVNLNPATAPTVAISEPANETEYRENEAINFVGSVSDGEDRPESLNVYWEAEYAGSEETGPGPQILDIEPTVTSDGTVTGIGIGLLTAVPSSTALQHTDYIIKLVAEDTSGRKSEAQVSIKIYPIEAPPEVAIQTPLADTTVVAGELMLFEAVVNDERDPLDELIVTWVSIGNGDLGTSEADSSGSTTFAIDTLSVGRHFIEATVTDRDGQTGTDTVEIEIIEATPEEEEEDPVEETGEAADDTGDTVEDDPTPGGDD